VNKVTNRRHLVSSTSSGSSSSGSSSSSLVSNAVECYSNTIELNFIKKIFQ